jgi:sugar/nucleoside kinase (ribokinase family)
LTSIILAGWDVAVSLVSVVGDDDLGRRARADLAGAGVDVTWLASRADQTTTHKTISSDNQGEQTAAEVVQGPRLVRGDRLDIHAIFGHDLVLLDLDDFALRQFLVDLPAHTVPTTRLLGTLTHIAESSPEHLRVALAHDALVGTESEFLTLTAASMVDEGLSAFQQAMRVSNLRAAILLRPTGTTILTPAARSDIASAVQQPTSPPAHAALLAGIAYGMAHRWAWEHVVPFAATAATLAGASRPETSETPSLAQISALLESDPATLNP